MACPWIKIRIDLDTDPRVLTMADLIAASSASYVLSTSARDLLGVTPTVTRDALRDVTLASLFRVWRDANHHTRDGVFRHCSLDYIDTLARIPGFGRAMAAVGWAVEDATARTVTLVNFLEMNTPRKAAGTTGAARQKRYRDRKRDAVVTVTSDVTRDTDRDRDREGIEEREQPPQAVARPAGIPSSEAAARALAGPLGVDPDYAATVWHELEGRGGCDDKGNPVRNFSSHLKARANYRQSSQAEKAARRPIPAAAGKDAAPTTGDVKTLYARYMGLRETAQQLRTGTYRTEAERADAATRLHTIERQISDLETAHNFTPPKR